MGRKRRPKVIAGALVALAGLAGAVSAGGAAPHPWRIHRATLVQSGRQLVLTIDFDDPVRVSTLTAGHRAVCLLRERASSKRLVGSLCLTGRGLTFTRVGGRQRPVAGAIRRLAGDRLRVSFLPGALAAPYASMGWQVSSSLVTTGCAGARSAACRQLFPKRPGLARLHVPRLVGCVPSGASFVTNGPRSVHDVALTFDDGPWYDTPQFLTMLEREHVPATFFQIGRQIAQYGGIDRRILAAGDLIGDHTWDHADVAGGGAFAAGEIAEARDAIRARTGFTPCLFRAPGGAVSPGLISLARSMGLLTIQWDDDTRDWTTPGTAAIYGTAMSEVQNGSIILHHDGGGNRSQTLTAVPQEIATLRRRGYRFVTIAGLLGLRLIYK